METSNLFVGKKQFPSTTTNYIFTPNIKMTDQEAQMLALNDLEETMVDLVKLKRELAIDSSEGIHLNKEFSRHISQIKADGK